MITKGDVRDDRWQELHGSCFHGKGSSTRSPPTSAHLSRPTVSSRRPPTTYGFNSDVENLPPNASSCLYSEAGLLAASIWRVPPAGALRHHPVLPRDRRPGTSWAVVGVIHQVSKQGVVRAAEGRSGSESWTKYMWQWRWTRAPPRALSRRDIVMVWRGAVKIYILECLKDVDFGYTSAMPVLSGLQFLRRRKGTRRGFVCVHVPVAAF
jgi:hypothetical protein